MVSKKDPVFSRSFLESEKKFISEINKVRTLLGYKPIEHLPEKILSELKKEYKISVKDNLGPYIDSSEEFIENCFEDIKKQSKGNMEVIYNYDEDGIMVRFPKLKVDNIDNFLNILENPENYNNNTVFEDLLNIKLSSLTEQELINKILTEHVTEYENEQKRMEEKSKEIESKIGKLIKNVHSKNKSELINLAKGFGNIDL
jgi:hypothetical protein